MLVTDGTVSASDGAFDVPEDSVDPLERGRQGSLAARSCDNRLMDAPGFADAGETAQTVTDDGAGGIEIALGQGHDFGPAENLYPAQLQADWLPFRPGFDRSHNRRLSGRTAATLATVPLAAAIGVVHSTRRDDRISLRHFRCALLVHFLRRFDPDNQARQASITNILLTIEPQLV